MKKQDLGVIVAVGIFAAIFSLVIASFLITPKSTKGLKAQKIDAINSSFEQPDKRYFNDQSINPTQLIQIGNNAQSKQ